MSDALQQVIDAAWERRDEIGSDTKGDVRDAVEEAIRRLDAGEARVAEKGLEGWHVNQWLKKAVLLSFRLNPMEEIPGGPGGAMWWDKVPSKFAGWDAARFAEAEFRAVPGAIVRRGAFIAKGAVLMPSFVNIGGVLEPLQAGPVIIEDHCFIGARSEVAEGVVVEEGAVLSMGVFIGASTKDHCFIGARSEVAEGVVVEEGAVLSMGVFIGASTKIVDRATGEVFMGRVPSFSVVVPGTLPGRPIAGGNEPAPGLACAVIVKRVDAQTRSKTGINELLRD